MDNLNEELNICRCVVAHHEEGEDKSAVNSKAIVKLQTVLSPVNFSKLQCNTDLNLPPSNWLTNSANSYGLQQALSHSTGFTSFRMAHMFPDCVGEVDVVSNAENIKNLLKLPYSPKSTISMMVHRIENTLLIDEFDIHKYLLRQADDDWQWLKSFICENILTSLSDRDRHLYIKNKSREALQQRSLLSKFLYHSLLGRTSETITEQETADKLIQQNLNISRSLNLIGPLLPEPSVDENVPDPQTNHTYNRNVVWTFEDIRMLIGTDMPIFGGATRPCISLRLRDMSQPINVLTGIDYWLDNLMCNVPEVVMCYHLDGLVQKYELIKTEDLPYLENSKFSPKIIRNVAQNILAFLKQNATKAGHTYWLFKGANDDFVKLYDLTSLCTDSADNVSAEVDNGSEQKNDNPFTVPVAMLLYKVAKNLKGMTEHISAKQAASIKILLDNCLQLLPKEKYPQIVTSSHYILSDLHIPAAIDPNSPNFFYADNESDENSVYDDVDFETASAMDQSDVIDKPYENVVLKSIRETFNEFNMEKHWKHNSSPPSITADVVERCLIALQHIVDGLSCLQYFSTTEEKLSKEKEEIDKANEKQQIILEELNPNMAKPFLAIPLPYEKLKPEPKLIGTDDVIPMGWKESDAGSSTAATGKPKSKRSRKKSTSNSKADAQNTNNKSLIVKEDRPAVKVVIESWNVHLKLLLLEKACLTYAILTEQSYHREEYGKSLKYIFIAMKCEEIVLNHMAAIQTQKVCILGRAGDCYFQIAKNVQLIEKHLEAFRFVDDIDKAMKDELKLLRKNYAESPTPADELTEPTANIEQLMLNSCAAYEAALKYATDNSRREFIGRLGSIHNELGVKYMHWAQEEYVKYETNRNDEKPSIEPQFQILTKKSYDCLIRGVAAFEEIDDNANLAILLCNMGRFMRFRAHINMIGESDDNILMKRKFYDSAFTNYQRALGILVARKQNPELWDLVNWELSTCAFTLAQHMMEFTKVDSMTEEREQEIIELIMNALKLCDTETPSSRQILYSFRAGLICHRLGKMYLIAYNREHDNEVRRRKLIQLCRLYYEKSMKTFEALDEPKEYLHIQIDRLELQECLCDVLQNATAKLRNLQTSLDILLQSHIIFDSINEKLEFSDEIKVLLERFERKLQCTLKQLIKICMANKSVTSFERLIAIYKNLYSKTLNKELQTSNLDVNQLAIHLKMLLVDFQLQLNNANVTA